MNLLQAANAIITACLSYETDGSNPPDGRRVIRDERQSVMVAASKYEAAVRAANDTYPAEEAATRLESVVDEAKRVLDMWG